MELLQITIKLNNVIKSTLGARVGWVSDSVTQQIGLYQNKYHKPISDYTLSASLREFESQILAMITFPFILNLTIDKQLNQY